MNRWMTSLLVAVVCHGLWAEMIPTNGVETVFSELMFQTTNYWGRDAAAFRAAADSCMRKLRLASDGQGDAYRMKWLETLLSMQAPTNSYEAYRNWLDIRGRWIFGLGGKFKDASYTNLWFAAADELHRLRDGVPSEKEIADRYRSVAPDVTSGQVMVWSGMPDAYYEEMGMRTARLDAASTLACVVVDDYGCRALPRLRSDLRMSVYSNLVERAGLSADEALKIGERLDQPE